MLNRIANFLAAFLLAQLTMLPALAGQPVTVADKGSHFEVVLDFESAPLSHKQMGQEYGKAILAAAPNYEKLLDSYLWESSFHKWFIYRAMLHRVAKLRAQIPAEYQDEIEGIASCLSGKYKNIPGDGKVSVDELYMLNLIADIARLNQCCAVGVFGERTADGYAIVGRNLDWPDGKENQLAQIQSVVTIKDGPRSTTNVACLGFQGGVSTFNSSGIFAGLLDSGTGRKYRTAGKRSYSMDLRYALETCRTLKDVSAFMSENKRHYTFNHSIILADDRTCAVLENNLSGFADSRQRILRTSDSKLRQGVEWGIDGAVGCVNCFELACNDDNHISPLDWKRNKRAEKPFDINTSRWLNIKQQLAQLGPKVSAQGIEQVISYYKKGGRRWIYDGDLYNKLTMQCMVFTPHTMSFSVAFRPRDGSMPDVPKYQVITVPLTNSSAEAVAECGH